MSDFLSFHLSDDFVNHYADLKPDWGFDIGGGNSLSELTFITKYSRLKDDGTKEQWYEVCRRCIEGMYSILKDHCAHQRTPWNEFKAQKAAQDAFDRMFHFKWTPPGRGMWAMGTRFVHENKSNSSLNNCSFLSTEKLSTHSAYEATMPFTRLMEMSMNGVGVGFDTRGAGKLTIWEPAGDPITWTIPDTREGWAESVGKLLETYFFKNRQPVQFDYSQIRPAGSLLKSFGGRASGPVPLMNLHESIVKQFAGRHGSKITSRDIVDIMNKIAKAVVAGGARRSALISLGEANDDDYVNIKNWELPENAERTGPDGWAWACFPDETWVQTSNGPKQVRDLVGVPFTVILNGKPFDTEGFFLSNEEADLFQLETKQGFTVKATANHPFMTKDGWKLLEELNPGDKVLLNDHGPLSWDGYGSYNEGYLLGHLWGDGTLVRGTGQGTRGVLSLFASEIIPEWMSDIERMISSLGSPAKFYTVKNGIEARIGSKILGKLAADYGMVKGSKKIGDKVEGASSEFYRGFISGAFDTDGHVQGNGSKLGFTLVLSQSDRQQLQIIQRMLLRLGIKSSIRMGQKLETSDMAVRQSWTLAVGSQSADLFMDEIGLKNPHKLSKANSLRGENRRDMGFYVDVVSVTAAGFDRVYDLTVPDVHAFDANGFVVHNSNNSVFVNEGDDLSHLIDKVAINGEPGIVWLDVMRKYGRLADSPNNKDYRVSGTNPCVTSDTWTMTATGPRQVFELIDSPHTQVVDGVEYKATGFWYSGDKEVFNVTFADGRTLRLTGNHKLQVEDGRWIEVDNLDVGDKVKLNRHLGYSWDGVGSFEEGYVLGHLIGDGTFDTSNKPFLAVWEQDPGSDVVADYLLDAVSSMGHRSDFNGWFNTANQRRLGTSALRDLAAKYEVVRGNKTITPEMEAASSDFSRGVLSGLFDTDGSVQGSTVKGVSVRLSNTDLSLLESAQRMLLRLGVNSSIYFRRDERQELLPDGRGGMAKYICKPQWELIISRENLRTFSDRIGFVNPVKAARLEELLSSYKRDLYKDKFISVVTEITAAGVEPVYDVTVDQVHAFDANGLIAHNCAEISLESNEFCVSSDTLIQTNDGLFKIQDIAGSYHEIFNGKSWSKSNVFYTGINELYRVYFSDGSYLDATPKHRWLIKTSRNDGLDKFAELETLDLKEGMRLPKFELDIPDGGVDLPSAYTWGWFAGDGYIDKNYTMALVQENEYSILDALDTTSVIKEQHPASYSKPFKRVRFECINIEAARQLRTHAAPLPSEVLEASVGSLADFFAGWIDADGSLVKNGDTVGLRLYGDELKLRQAQILLRRIGINFASLNLFAEAGAETNFGPRTQDLWYIQIPSFEAHLVPTKLKLVEEQNNRYRRNPAHSHGEFIDRSPVQKIVKIEKLPGIHHTYCFEEPELHQGVFGNVLTKQCNLSELYPVRHSSFDDFKKSIKHAYMYTKAVTLMPSTWAETNEVITRNRRIGVSMTGVVEFIETRSWSEMKEWMDEGYGYLSAVDTKYSEWLGVRNSIKVTTIKPAGTTSLIAGTTAGIHWPTTTGWFLRRVRFSVNDPIVDVIKKAGYHVEPDVNDPDFTLVAEFPTKGLDLRSEREVSIWEKAHLAAMAQKFWADNMVSVTVSFKPEEEKEIGPLLRSLDGQLKSVSFLPISDGGTSYVQAPYEPITEEEAKKRMKKVKPFDMSKLYMTGDGAGDQYCTTDVCEIKF